MTKESRLMEKGETGRISIIDETKAYSINALPSPVRLNRLFWSSSIPLFHYPFEEVLLLDPPKTKEQEHRLTTGTSTEKRVRSRKKTSDFKPYHCLSVPLKVQPTTERLLGLGESAHLKSTDSSISTSTPTRISRPPEMMSSNDSGSNSKMLMINRQTSTLSIEMKDEETQTIQDHLASPSKTGITPDHCDRGTSPISFNLDQSSSSNKYREMERITGHIIIHKFITRTNEDFQKIVELQFPHAHSPTFAPTMKSDSTLTPSQMCQKETFPHSTESEKRTEHPQKSSQESDKHTLLMRSDYYNQKSGEDRQKSEEEKKEEKQSRERLLEDQLELFEASASIASEYFHPHGSIKTQEDVFASTEDVDKSNKNVIISSNESELKPPLEQDTLWNSLTNERFQNICTTTTQISPSNETNSQNNTKCASVDTHTQDEMSKRILLISRISEERFDETQITSQAMAKPESGQGEINTNDDILQSVPGTCDFLETAIVSQQQVHEPLVLNLRNEIEISGEKVIVEEVHREEDEEGGRSTSSSLQSECYDGEKDDTVECSASSMSSMNSHCSGNFVIQQLGQPGSSVHRNIATQTDEKSFVRTLLRTSSLKEQQNPSSAESINSSTCLNLLEVKLRVEKINLSVRVGGHKKKRAPSTIAFLPSAPTTTASSPSSILQDLVEDDDDQGHNISLDLLEVKGKSIKSTHNKRSRSQTHSKKTCVTPPTTQERKHRKCSFND